MRVFTNFGLTVLVMVLIYKVERTTCEDWGEITKTSIKAKNTKSVNFGEHEPDNKISIGMDVDDLNKVETETMNENQNDLYQTLFLYLIEQLDELKKNFSEAQKELKLATAKLQSYELAKSKNESNEGIFNPRDSFSTVLWKISSSNPASKINAADVILSPKARIYNQNQSAIDNIDFYFNPQQRFIHPHCTSLWAKLEAGGRHIFTYSRCVRLFSEHNCYGNSTAYYPKLDQLSTEYTTIPAKSIGSCFVNELDDSSFRLSSAGVKHFQKASVEDQHTYFVPDDVNFGREILVQTSLGKLFVESTNNLPVTHYRTGHYGRVELIWATVSRNDLEKKGCPEKLRRMLSHRNITNRLAELHSEASDVEGFFISPSFCPHEEVLENNVFYQSPWNQKRMREVEETISSFILQNMAKTVQITIHVLYHREESMRPSGIIYKAVFDPTLKITKEGSQIAESNVRTFYLANPIKDPQ